MLQPSKIFLLLLAIICCLYSVGALISTNFHRALSTSSLVLAMNTMQSNGVESETVDHSHDCVNEDSEIKLLPPVSTMSEGETRSISLGESIKFEELGPIIINTDGTTRRIENWNTLSPQEKASSWRLISKRNAQRLEALKRQQSSTTSELAAE